MSGKSCSHLAVTFLLISGCFASSQTSSQPLGQPQVFSPDVLSVGRVYRGTFARDGRTFYFFKKLSERGEDYRIFVSRLVKSAWTQPQPLRLGGDYSDLYPALSPDGKRLVFCSYRPAPGDSSGKPNSYLWYVDRQGDGWGEPVFMAAANTLGNYHSWVEFGPDGAVYYRSTLPDWRTNQFLITRWNGKEFTPPERFTAVERWEKWRKDLYVWGGGYGPDGKTLFFDISTIDAATKRTLPSDIWVSRKQGNDWTEPQRLADGINSPGYDNFWFFSPDGRELFFVRDFRAIYRVPLRQALQNLR